MSIRVLDTDPEELFALPYGLAARRHGCHGYTIVIITFLLRTDVYIQPHSIEANV